MPADTKCFACQLPASSLTDIMSGLERVTMIPEIIVTQPFYAAHLHLTLMNHSRHLVHFSRFTTSHIYFISHLQTFSSLKNQSVFYLLVDIVSDLCRWHLDWVVYFIAISFLKVFKKHSLLLDLLGLCLLQFLDLFIEGLLINNSFRFVNYLCRSNAIWNLNALFSVFLKINKELKAHIK